MVQHRFTASIRGIALVAVAGYAVLTACRLAVPFVTVVAGPLLTDGSGGLDSVAFDDALAGLSAAVLLGCVLWLSVTTALTVAVYVAQELAPGTRLVGTLGRAVDRSCPAAMGRLVAGALGVAVTVGFAGPALAQDGPVHPVSASPTPVHPAPAHSTPVHPTPAHSTPAHPTPLGASFGGSDRLSGLALPDRPTGTGWAVQVPRSAASDAAPAARPSVRPGRSGPSPRPPVGDTATPHPATPAPAVPDPAVGESPAPAVGESAVRDVPVRDVVVRPGQSLWTIADGLLPAPATDAQITRAWQHLAQANASVIGADPDLILPGTRLVVPDLDASPLREEAP